MTPWLTSTSNLVSLSEEEAAIFNNQKKMKSKHAHQPIEVFQKHNAALISNTLKEEGYDKLNEEAMADQIADRDEESEETYEARVKATKSKCMRLRMRVVNTMWLEATLEERQAVMEAVEAEKVAIAKAECEREESQSMRTPQQYQDRIDALPLVYGAVNKAAWDEAGWCGMTLMAGLNPRLDGDLSMKM
ncbi:hypothetical protein B0H10DRAFT_2222422 [Mycena sp. CBHHK59/15]|nr:hypothetical protein B0H10DRAFT_2222422 [Mycena sp. CBHHK59/15]